MKEYEDYEIEDSAGVIVWFLGIFLLTCTLSGWAAWLIYLMIKGEIF